MLFNFPISWKFHIFTLIKFIPIPLSLSLPCSLESPLPPVCVSVLLSLIGVAYINMGWGYLLCIGFLPVATTEENDSPSPAAVSCQWLLSPEWGLTHPSPVCTGMLMNSIVGKSCTGNHSCREFTLQQPCPVQKTAFCRILSILLLFHSFFPLFHCAPRALVGVLM